MKKSVKIGFPIVCVVIVGGTLIALSNLQNKVKEESNQKMQNNATNSTNVVYENEYRNEYENYYDNEIENKTNINNTNNINTNNSNNTNTVENTISVKNTTNTDVSNSTEETEDADNISDKDRAIALVQDEWGSDPSVYFTSEGMSSGNYIVAVRDKSNTSVKMFYKVNLQNNTVEIDW